MKTINLRNEVLEDLHQWNLDRDMEPCSVWPVVLDPHLGHKYTFDKVTDNSNIYEETGLDGRVEDFCTITTVSNHPTHESRLRVLLSKRFETTQYNPDTLRRPNIRNDDPNWGKRSAAEPLMQGRLDIVRPQQFSSKYVGKKNRIIIIDSGSSTNVISEDVAEQTISRFIGDIAKDLELETANNTTTSSQGVRMQIADWDLHPCANLSRVNTNFEVIKNGQE